MSTSGLTWKCELNGQTLGCSTLSDGLAASEEVSDPGKIQKGH